MSDLVFYFSCMNGGKSTAALQLNYSLKQSGFKPQMLKPATDTRDVGVIKSRMGLEHPCDLIFDDNVDALINSSTTHVIVDEAQFLTKSQVINLAGIADFRDRPVYCFGLRTSYTGDLFEGSAALMAIADNLVDMPIIGSDGNKSVMHLRYVNGEPIFDGDPIFVGDINEEYKSVSRRQYYFIKYEYDVP